MRSLLAAFAVLLLAGCRREPSETPTAEFSAALMAPRTIPLRLIQVVGACQRCNPALACSPADVCSPDACAPDPLKPANVEARIREASEVYAVANLSFALASLEKYSMPDLLDYGSSTRVPWTRARFQLRQALPHMPCNAWPEDAALTAREWVIQASTRYSPPEAIPFWVTPVSMGGYGIYPWRARAILIDANQINRHRDTNFSHEIGHFLGLPHAFDSVKIFRQGSYNIERGTIRTPRLPGFLGHSDFWEFVYLPGAPNRFFQSRAELRPGDEPALRTIETWDLSPERPSNCQLDQRTCAYTCDILGESLRTGDPRLRALSFVVPTPGGPPRLGINVMDYNQSPNCTANSLAESQVQQLRRVLAADMPLDDQRTFPGMTGLRPRLGVYGAPPPVARIDVDHNHEERSLPPVYLTEHPPWADDLDEGPALAER